MSAPSGDRLFKRAASMGSTTRSMGLANAGRPDRLDFDLINRRDGSPVVDTVSVASDDDMEPDRVPYEDFTTIGTPIVLFASVCAYLVIHLAPYAAGSGTAEVKTILGGFIIKKFLGIKTLLVKAVGLPLMVASGLAVGKEGPMVHLACCVANVFPRLFSKYWRNEARKREILSAASGAGIAVAFGAPIGGVLFSLEELSSFFPAKTMVRSFFCALVATVTLQLVDPYRGKRVLYQVSYSRPWHFFEILFFLILGIFGGLSGALFVKASKQMLKFRKSSRLAAAPLREAILIALATAMLCYFNDFTRVDSSDLLEALFRECEEADFHGLCRDIGTKLANVGTHALGGLGLTLLTTVTSGPTPATQCFKPAIPTAISLTVVMFELTGTLNYIVPCMITLMTAKVIGDLCGKGGMAEMQIRTNQYPFLDPRVDEVVGLPASKVMTPVAELVCFVSAGMRLADVESALEQMNFKGFPVVNNFDDSFMLGYISREDLEYAIGKAKMHENITADSPVFFDSLLHGGPYPSAFVVDSSGSRGSSDPRLPPISPVSPPPFLRGLSSRFFRDGSIHLESFVDKTPLYVHPKVPVELVMDMFKKLGPRYIMVVHSGRLRGIITKKGLLAAIHGDDEPVYVPGAALNHGGLEAEESTTGQIIGRLLRILWSKVTRTAATYTSVRDGDSEAVPLVGIGRSAST
ncbi:glycerol ethanol, ferric requiring protein [Gaertneriomyces sp. JEL0708]|nr:glycerol ethanol, ferric requiring protein [Gaertneriomyces sp. JEL0708]